MPFFRSSSEASSSSSLIPLSLTLIQPPQHCHQPLSRPSTTITQPPFPLASHCEIQPPIIYKIRQARDISTSNVVIFLPPSSQCQQSLLLLPMTAPTTKPAASQCLSQEQSINPLIPASP